jgi:hypothetical protein
MDPMTYAAVSGALAAVMPLAMYLPARRTSRVDPVVALIVLSAENDGGIEEASGTRG